MLLIVQSDPLVPPGLITGCLDAAGLAWQLWRADRDRSFPAADAVILLGGTMGVNDERRYPFLRQLKLQLNRWLVDDVPLLGICLGSQLLAQVAGGKFNTGVHGEHGVVRIDQTRAAPSDPLFSGLPAAINVFQWHDDSFLPPPRARLLATSPTCPAQAFRIGDAWGVQFHPEVDAAIVASWSRLRPDSELYCRQYQRYAAELTERARQLLMNFIDFLSKRNAAAARPRLGVAPDRTPQLSPCR